MGLSILALGMLVGAPAQSAAARPTDGILSPRLAELAKPAVRSAPPAVQARRLSLPPEGAASLLRVGNRVLVDVRFATGAAAGSDDLRAAGARVVNVSSRYQTVTVAVKPSQLRALTTVPGVLGATEVLTPVVAGAGADGPVASAAEPCFGAATSEGDLQLRAAEARKAFGVDGNGVTVGILSDSFDVDQSAATSAAADVKTGDLPGPGNPCGRLAQVEVLEEIESPEEGEDEGRAMAQVVHDLAPGAQIAFASAFNGQDAFAANIRRLAEPPPAGAGATVIADDVFYADEPFFQDGPVAAAVDQVAGEGVAYYSAAGNDNLVAEPESGVENDFASWEAPAFRDAESCPPGVPSYANHHCMDFDPGAGVDDDFRITVEPESEVTVDLQWSQPWFGVTTDLDAYLLSGGAVVARSEFPNTEPAFQEPVEILSWTNPSPSSRIVTLAIDRCNLICGAQRATAHPEELGGTTGGDSGTPLLKFALLENGGGVSSTEYPISAGGDTVGPTIFGHAGSAGAVSVGAVPFFSESEPEPYSSRGPVKHYFGPVEGTSPALPLIPAETLEKPDVAATDGGANTFFGFCLGKAWRFFGTSAAAPHAAAVAALELSAKPTASATEVIEAQEENARAVGAFPASAVGSGLLDAFGSIGELLGSSATPEAAEGPGFPPPDCTIHPAEESRPEVVAPQPPAPQGAPPSEQPQAPQTSLRRVPPKTILTLRSTTKAFFLFGSNQPGVTFLCRVDRARFHRCPVRFVRVYGLGPHVLRVKARNSAGKTDATPAVYRFRVRPVESRR